MDYEKEQNLDDNNDVTASQHPTEHFYNACPVAAFFAAWRSNSWRRLRIHAWKGISDIMALLHHSQQDSVISVALQTWDIFTVTDRIMEKKGLYLTGRPGLTEMWNRVYGCRCFSIIMFVSIMIFFFMILPAYNTNMRNPSQIPLFWYVLKVLKIVFSSFWQHDIYLHM